MTFPIAVGTGPRHSSSRPFPKFSFNNKNNYDGQIGIGIGSDGNGNVQQKQQQHQDDHDVIMALGTNADGTLTATVFISYHFIALPNASHDDYAPKSHHGGYNVVIDGSTKHDKDDGDDDVGSTNDATNHDSITNESDGHGISTHAATTKATNLQRESPSSSIAIDDDGSVDTRCYNVVAELRVQITPSTSPFGSNADAMSSRETKSRVPLGIMRKQITRRCNTPAPTPTTTTKTAALKAISATTYAPNASIEFASNETHLACLIPLPLRYELISSSSSSSSSSSAAASASAASASGICHDDALPTSTIVIFRIRAQKFSSQQQLQQKKQRNLPKLPDYIVENSINNNNNDGDIMMNDGLENGTAKRDDYASGAADESSQGESSRGKCSMLSYVAHEPKIVRDPRCRSPTSKGVASQEVATTSLPKNGSSSFLRQFSSGKSAVGGGRGGAGAVVGQQPPSLRCGTCLCNVPSSSGHRHPRGGNGRDGKYSSVSMLMVGTMEGALLLVDFAAARVVRSIASESVAGGSVASQIRTQCHGHGSQNGGEYFCNPIVHLSQCTPTRWKPLDVYGEEQGSESKGRIALVLRDGSVNLYTTSFVVPSVELSDPSGGPNDDVVENVTDRSINVDRRRGSRNTMSKYAGLEMRMELLATSRTSEKLSDSGSTSRLRYIKAKWLNPLVLILLTRSPLLDQRREGAGALPSSEMVVTQAWTVAEVEPQNENRKEERIVGDWEIPPNVDADVALVSELKMPCGEDGLDERAHSMFSPSRRNSAHADGEYGRHSRPECSSLEASLLAFRECARGMSISYHRGTDCLAINSQAVTCASASTGAAPSKLRPFCLIWDWKRNVPGLTLASSKSYCLHEQNDVRAEIDTSSSLFSWFHLGESEDFGLCAVHVYGQTLSKGRRRASKNVFSLSTLSPLNRFASEGSLSLNEPSAVLLHHDSVTFPSLGTPSNNAQDVSLRWEESRVPPAYVASNGPCRIAAVGKDNGRSIAVAASRGLCVASVSIQSRHPRWKQFSNVNDEQRFRVVSMTWFERGNETTQRTKEDSTDDLLLAVVQYINADTLHLVCWSRKRLGFGENQLLKDSSSSCTGEGEYSVDDTGSQLGVPLPPGFRVHSMSIISDPADGMSTDRSTPSNRALLSLASVSCHGGANSCVNYAVYQLQIIQSLDRKSEQVLARNSAVGKIPLQLGTSPDFSAAESVIGIFVAGGSFLFDLNAVTDDRARHDVIAVIGVVTVFQGLIAVCVNQTGPILYRPCLLENTGECRIGYRKSLIVSYWRSGSISSRLGCRVAWSIAENDGKVYCWSVPCRNAESSNWSDGELNGNQCSEVLPGLEKHSILGDICRLGKDWVNGATTSEREISIGPFCPLSFGCILYAGQRSRKNTSLSDSVATTSFNISNCIVAPPQFTPFLFISFLSLSSASSDVDFEWQLVNRPGQEISNSHGIETNHEIARDHIKFTLFQLKNLGSSSSALRRITMKVIDLLNQSKGVSDMCVGNENEDKLSNETRLRLQKWTVGKAMLSEIVTVAKEMWAALGFATFFLSIGRQLEPHQFNLIFPLPSELFTPNQPPLRTAEDLFSVSCSLGSLSTALSALPLFSCHEESQRSVAKLIYHCLIKIEENFRSCASYTALTSGEDEAFLHQLFWFGVKLEDAIEIENSYEKQDEWSCPSDSTEDKHSSQSSQSSVSSSSTEESSIDQDTDEFVSVSPSVESHVADCTLGTYSSEESHDVSFLSPCRTPNQKHRVGVIKKVVTKIFPSADSPDSSSSLEEDAIQEAASSFIFSGFDEVPLKSPHCTPLPEVSQLEMDDDNPSDSDESNDAVDTLPLDELSHPSVAGAISIFIRHAIAFGGAYENDTQNYGWKAVSAIAHILQGDRETLAITTAGSSNAQSIAASIEVKDFIAAATTHCHLGHHSADKKKYCNTVANLLVRLASDCRRQIHSQAFGTVFNLILLLLLRYDSCRDVELCRATLIAVGLVSGHLSGRIGELLDLTETPCDAKDIYLMYTAKYS